MADGGGCIENQAQSPHPMMPAQSRRPRISARPLLLAQTMATMGSGNSGIESFNPVPLGGEAPQPSSLLVPPQA